MTRLRNVGGKITEITGGSESLYSGKDIVYNASKAINFTGTNGIEFGQPEKRTDLRVTRVEGPFNESGTLVSEVAAGQSYVYKATPSRTPTASEVLLLKWAAKLDDSEIAQVPGGSGHNQLAEGKIIVGLKINTQFKKGKVYAYFNAPDESISVAVNGKDKYPMLILQGSRRKGRNRDNTGTAADMLFNDYTEDEAGFAKLKQDLYNITYEEQPQNSWYNVTSRADNARSQADFKTNMIKEYCRKNDTELFEIFKSEIQGWYSSGVLETVAGQMVDRMQGNQGGEFVNRDLTTAVLNHENSKNFIAGVKGVIEQYVKDNKGNIDALEITDDGKGRLYDKLVENNVSSPRFSDWFSGLGITINDVWAYQVFITSHAVNGNKFEMRLEYVYYDHFGLDYPDIQKFDKSIFYSWFVLQHFRGYKPFITKLEITGPLNGTF